MESAAGDVVLGGAKKLLADAHADTGEGKRALLNDALASPETHTARKLAGYWRRWVTPWRYHRGRKLLADAVGAGEGKRALLSAAVAAHDDTLYNPHWPQAGWLLEALGHPMEVPQGLSCTGKTHMMLC
uniref:Uncharacterized protein n=1 Tax=Tetradesmus obliquus TaxID=3088 RepID=A0A383W8U9_TETOB|eukprot:jgi/Sobl393_1/15705/SZX73116.1